MLGVLSQPMRTIAIAGTHGKTTVTAMPATILRAAGKNQRQLLAQLFAIFQSRKTAPIFLSDATISLL